jgi:hypothetical protein
VTKPSLKAIQGVLNDFFSTKAVIVKHAGRRELNRFSIPLGSGNDMGNKQSELLAFADIYHGMIEQGTLDMECTRSSLRTEVSCFFRSIPYFNVEIQRQRESWDSL